MTRQPGAAEAGSLAPEYRAFAIERSNGDPVHIVLWCPWCEAEHTHGAAGGGGSRGPHCAEDRSSPLIHTGYRLNIKGDVGSLSEVRPAGLLVGTQRLHQVAFQASGPLRAVLLRYLLGIKTVRGSVLQKRTAKGGVWIFGAEDWLIEENGWEPIRGRGFINLAAKLYGVPPGIAAVRLLEAVSFDLFDTQAAFEIQRAVDAWMARGAPMRASR